MARQRRGRAGVGAAVNAAVANAVNADTDDNAPLTDTNVLDFLCKSMRGQTHWRPSKALARCLGVPYTRLLLSTRKEDASNLVWSTVLALACCATRLAEHHEAWYALADAAVAWLHTQPHYVERREDLAHSACALLSIRDEAALLATLFAEPKSAEQLALEAALGDWKQCYLAEPPYSLYYWNERTSHSTWRNPLETAQQQQQERDRLERRAALLAKILPQRLAINRDVRPSEPVVLCSRCRQQQTPVPREATVLCRLCVNSSGSGSNNGDNNGGDGVYYCDDCCDDVHSDRALASHCDVAATSAMRFRQCVGVNGFPRTSTASTSIRLPSKTKCKSFVSQPSTTAQAVVLPSSLGMANDANAENSETKLGFVVLLNDHPK